MEKLQLIRQEIEQRMELLKKLKKNDFTDGSIDAYKGILILIDSLPKEPKFKIGDRISRKGKPHEYVFTVQEVLDDCYILDDDKMLTFNWEDEWELAQNEAKFLALSKKELMKAAIPFREILKAVPAGPERNTTKVLILKDDENS